MGEEEIIPSENSHIVNSWRLWWNAKARVYSEFRTFSNVDKTCLTKLLVTLDCGKSVEILELGMGDGTVACQILKAFPHATYTGIDVSDEMIRIARSKIVALGFSERSRLLRKECHQISALESKKYDACIAMTVFHHLPPKSAPQCFEEIHRLLRKEGILVFLEDWLDYGKGISKEKVQITSEETIPEHFFNTSQYVLMIKNAGFRILDITKLQRLLEPAWYAYLGTRIVKRKTVPMILITATNTE